MATDNIIVNSTTGVDGNSYTTAISNDKLSNNDFLKLLLEEMKMQDPTKPMDSKALMDSQLKMSQIESNKDMSKALESLSSSFKASSLSNAVGFMGKTVANGSIDEETNILNSYKVNTIESINGEIYVNTNKQIGFHHNIRTSKEVDGQTTYVDLTYNNSGKIFDEDGADTGVNIVIEDNGSFKVIDGKYVINDNDGNRITNNDILSKYEISGILPTYSTETSKIPVNSITKVYG